MCEQKKKRQERHGPRNFCYETAEDELLAKDELNLLGAIVLNTCGPSQLWEE